MTGRMIVFVIDGLGAGSPDRDQHTTRTICRAADPADFANLSDLGLREYVTPAAQPVRIWAQSHIPDSYLGHLEMIAAARRPRFQTLDDVATTLTSALALTRHRSGTITTNGDTIAVYDTLDAAAGLSISVMGGHASSAAQVRESAAQVRHLTELPRVICTYVPGLDVATALDKHCRTETGTTSPRHGFHDWASGIMRPPFTQQHLPAPVSSNNVLTCLTEAGLPVTLIGKTADLFATAVSHATAHHATSSADVRRHLLETMDTQADGLIYCNDRQLDLAAHSGNPAKAVAALTDIDATIGDVLIRMDSQDQLVVTADHGNDPTTGTGHTYESVPLLTTGPVTVDGSSGLACIARTITTAML